ncbi:hypothetical protein [Lysobacter gummosus]|uniref:hypothetical protein n=1 Tax=Lysobacter gummosus TaxID=262324 RepID=UPI0036385E37
MRPPAHAPPPSLRRPDRAWMPSAGNACLRCSTRCSSSIRSPAPNACANWAPTIPRSPPIWPG